MPRSLLIISINSIAKAEESKIGELNERSDVVRRCRPRDPLRSATLDKRIERGNRANVETEYSSVARRRRL